MGELSAAVLSPLARPLADGVEARCDRLSDRVQPLRGRHTADSRPAFDAVHTSDRRTLTAVLERPHRPPADARALRDFDTSDEPAALLAQLTVAERNPT